jgi:uncharacterized protein (TIGR02186 family)
VIRAALLLLLLALPARAQELVADLSQRRIDITTGFSGAEVLVFGAIEGEGDVVVVVRGPPQDMVLRRRERQAGIWVNGAEARFDQVPSFYAVASTRPLWQILPEAERRLNRVGVAALPIAPRGGGSDPEAFRLAFMGLKDAGQLYTENDPPAELVAGRLFSARMNFPATVVTGTYRIETMLVRAGRVTAQRHLSLEVRRVGVGAELWRIAHEWSLLYGIGAVLAAALAGWLGSLVFRRS